MRWASVVVHGVALALALAAAAGSWVTQPTGDRAERLPVWELDPDAITGGVYADAERRVSLTLRQQGDQPAIPWVTVELLAPAPPKEPSEQAGDFRGNERGAELLRGLARPLSRYRLPADAASDLGALGLQPCAARLVLELRQGSARELCVGGSVFGSGGRYLRALPAGDVFVVPPEPFLHLQRAASRLQDRRLLPKLTAREARVELTWAQGQRVLRRSAGGGWSVGEEEARDSTNKRSKRPAATWIAGLDALRLASYLPTSTPAPSGRAALEVQVTAPGAKPGWLRLYGAADGEAGPWVAASSHTLERLVRVPRWRAQELLEGLSRLEAP